MLLDLNMMDFKSRINFLVKKKFGQKDRHFAIGIKLKSLSLFTTDQEFKRVSTHADVELSEKDKCLTFKKLDIKEFGVFLDWVDDTTVI